MKIGFMGFYTAHQAMESSDNVMNKNFDIEEKE